MVEQALTEVWTIANKKIDWHANVFTPEKAYLCALFARLAYLHVPEYELSEGSRVKVVPCEAYQEIVRRGVAQNVDGVLAGADFGRFFVIERRLVIVVGVRVRDLIVVAIRGTKYLYDWKVNLNASRLQLPALGSTFYVHEGFFRAIASCFQALTGNLEAFGGRDLPIYVTGHSLGGAMAAILHALWAQRRVHGILGDGVPVHSAYTFGMPRYGDLNVVSWLPQPYHVYNADDIVPRVPPTWMGYAPCLVERVANDRGIKEVDGGASSTFATWILRLMTGSAIKEHFVERYLDRMRAQLP